MDQKPQPEKDPITCHVLDTTTGLPAVSMIVGLKAISPPEISMDDILEARTDADGRITHWGNYSVVKNLLKDAEQCGERSAWVMTFYTEDYFGLGKAFFPTVEVHFYVDIEPGSHVHVPLLLAPYSYTTYRGS